MGSTAVVRAWRIHVKPWASSIVDVRSGRVPVRLQPMTPDLGALRTAIVTGGHIGACPARRRLADATAGRPSAEHAKEVGRARFHVNRRPAHAEAMGGPPGEG